MLHYSIGLPSGGSWKLLEELHDPELKDLASHLPNTILHSWADSTVKKYLSAYRRWKKWAASHKLSVFLAKPHQFVLYLQYLGELTKSKSAVEEACNALSWVHASYGLDNPSTYPFVKTVLERLRRSSAKPVVKKEPVTVEMLEAMVRDAEESGTLSDLTLLAFSGFLRANELVNLKPCNCTLTSKLTLLRVKRPA